MAVQSYTKTGTKSTTNAKLPASFAEEVTNHELLKQAYEAYLANGRVASATTLKRGEVRGGGRKPWKQKGTGRARVGSIRSPIWRGGGITFGPSGLENHSKKISKTSKRKAIRQALSLAAKDGILSVIEDVAVKDGKTKEIVNLMQKLGFDRQVLLVVDTKTPELERATSNLSYVELVQANYLNVFNVMNAHHIVMTKKAVDAVDAWLGGKDE